MFKLLLLFDVAADVVLSLVNDVVDGVKAEFKGNDTVSWHKCGMEIERGNSM
jgi:uncharacterized protein with von Willebrand factor type A (vWA) domain